MTSTADHPQHDDHLRYLLDQRAARADLHARFPSQSDTSDSPSLYSHSPFSPQQYDIHGTPTSFLHAHSSRNPQPFANETRLPVSDRERLNYPEASSLDLDDDPRSSFDQQSIRSSIQDVDESGSEDDLEDDQVDRNEEEHRVSTYGPKMTVHSRAPWEMDEEEEQSSRRRKKKGSEKTSKAEGPKRPWGLVPRHSNEARPSVDSVRSSARSKQSFDTMSTTSSSGGGAIFALAQASFSSTSVAITPSPQPTLREKLSIPRLRSRTTPSVKGARLDPLDTRSMTPSLHSTSAHTSPDTRYRAASPSESVFSHRDTRPFYDSSSPDPHTPQRTHEYRHPYANPEFARASPTPLHTNQQLEELHNLANSDTYTSILGPSESSVTLTESHSSGGISQSDSGTTVSLTPMPSTASLHTKGDIATARYVQTRGTPVPINKAAIRTIPHNSVYDSGPQAITTSAMAGWTDNAASSIKLISLEEAQAQARERSRSATATASSVASPTVSRFNEAEPLPSPTSQTWSSRIRSTSANSSKVKNPMTSSLVDLDHAAPPLPTFPPDQNVSQRTIVRKKSGFMRLFNGKERASPPPVPSISSSSFPSPSPTHSIPTPRKSPLHRVPVPVFPSTGVDTSNYANPSLSADRPEFDSFTQLSAKEQLNMRRNVPGLSIVTSSSSPVNLNSRSRGRSVSPSASDSTHMGSSLTPTTGTTNTDSFLDSSIPNSAPPTSADFLGLSLRPVSTMFSTNFATHLVDRSSSDQSRPSLDADSGTPTTSSGISPLSPGFSVNMDGRAGYDKGIVSIASQQDDQSTVIQALQEQIMVARRAWQRQIWELEGQVRDLKAEVEDLRSTDSAGEYCSTCGRGSMGQPVAESEVAVGELKKAGVKVGGIVNRPRARTGVGSRFASGT